MTLCGEDARFDEARRRTGDLGGVTPPTFCSELKEYFLFIIGVVDPLSILNELELGVLRSDFWARRWALANEASLEFSSILECDCDCVRTGEEAGSGVAEAVSSDSRCKVAERFALVMFVDGGSDGNSMSLECSDANLFRSLRSMVVVSSGCCHSSIQLWCFKQQ